MAHGPSLTRNTKIKCSLKGDIKILVLPHQQEFLKPYPLWFVRIWHARWCTEMSNASNLEACNFKNHQEKNEQMTNTCALMSYHARQPCLCALYILCSPRYIVISSSPSIGGAGHHKQSSGFIGMWTTVKTQMHSAECRQTSKFPMNSSSALPDPTFLHPTVRRYFVERSPRHKPDQSRTIPLIQARESQQRGDFYFTSRTRT